MRDNDYNDDGFQAALKHNCFIKLERESAQFDVMYLPPIGLCLIVL